MVERQARQGKVRGRKGLLSPVLSPNISFHPASSILHPIPSHHHHHHEPRIYKSHESRFLLSSCLVLVEQFHSPSRLLSISTLSTASDSELDADTLTSFALSSHPNYSSLFSTHSIARVKTNQNAASNSVKNRNIPKKVICKRSHTSDTYTTYAPIELDLT